MHRKYSLRGLTAKINENMGDFQSTCMEHPVCLALQCAIGSTIKSQYNATVEYKNCQNYPHTFSFTGPGHEVTPNVNV